MDFIWQFACSWLWGMLSNSLSGSSPTSAHEVKLAQSKFGQFWMDKKFGVELMDILKPVASRGTSLSERNALLLSSPSLGGSRIAARVKALPLPQSGPRLDFGKTNIGGGHEDRSLKRPRQADRQLDNRNDSANKVSADTKEAGSSNDDVLASAPNQPTDKSDLSRSDHEAITQEPKNSNSDSSQSNSSQSNAPQGGTLMQETAVAPTGGTAVSTVTPLQDPSNVLTDKNYLAAQVAPEARPDKDGSTSNPLAASTSVEPLATVTTCEPIPFLLTKLKGDDAERAADLPVAFTLNFEAEPVRQADSQILHLRSHLTWDMAANQQTEGSDKLQIAQLRSDSNLLQPDAFNMKSPSLQALMRSAAAVEAKDEAASALDSGARAEGHEERGSTGYSSFFLTPAKGQYSEIEPVQQAERTGAVSDHEPNAKLPVSQLVLKLGSGDDASIAVRFNSRGSALKMEVLGGDQELRDSLRGSLSHLKSALERHSLDGGWKATGGLLPAELRLGVNEAATSSSFDPDAPQRNRSGGGHDERSPHSSGSKDGNDKKRESQQQRGSNGEFFSLAGTRSTGV